MISLVQKGCGADQSAGVAPQLTLRQSAQLVVKGRKQLPVGILAGDDSRRFWQHGLFRFHGWYPAKRRIQIAEAKAHLQPAPTAA
jgi:hypothetical protein